MFIKPSTRARNAGAFQSISIPLVTRGGDPESINKPPGVATPASSTRLVLPRYDFSPQRRPSRHVVGDVGVLPTPVVLLAPEDVAARPLTASAPTRPTAARASRRPDAPRGSSRGEKLATSCAYMQPWHGGTSDDVFRLTSSFVRRRRVPGVAAGHWGDRSVMLAG